VTLHSCKESKVLKFIQVNIGINQVLKPSLMQKHKSATFTQLWEYLYWYIEVQTGYLEVKIKRFIVT
jgi:hypothetical protein